MGTKLRECLTCLYMRTHEMCYTPGSKCLEYDENDRFKYLNWIFGTEEEQDARIDKLYRSGERSMVIGWTGEAEVNVLHGMEVTYERLCDISEQCGYLTRQIDSKTISIIKDTGEHFLTFDNAGLVKLQNGRVIQWKR